MENLTISILNYNGKDVLGRCIEAILEQKLEEYRLHVIDNASTDSSAQDAYKKYPVNSLINTDNLHRLITGLNKSFEYAKTPLVLFVSNDVFLRNGSIKSMLKLAKRFPKSIIQPVFYWPDLTVQNAGMKWIWPAYGLACRKLSIGARYFETPIVTSTAFLMSKEAFKEIGPFDENLAPGHYEDVDYSFRASKLGYKLLVDCKAAAIHEGSHSFGKVFRKRDISEIGHKNRKYIVRKFYSGFGRWSRLSAIECLDSINHVIHYGSSGKTVLDNKKVEGSLI